MLYKLFELIYTARLKTFQCGKKELEELFRNLESQLMVKDQERRVGVREIA